MFNRNVFESDSRTEIKKDGLLFYEQDVLLCKYPISGDAVLDFTMDYLSPGFGIVITEENENIKEAGDSYLFKIGGSDFRVFRYHALKQEALYTCGTLLASSSDKKNISIKVRIHDRKISMTWETAENSFLLGEYTMEKTLPRYKIGIYSNKGNLIRSIRIKQNVPDAWNVSIDNTAGGRISLEEDTIIFENCKHDAEIEQQGIELNPGFYCLKYNKSNINNTYDIDGFVFVDSVDTDNEGSFEDEKKNILEDNCFILEKPATVSLKFRGTNGKVSDICICENLYESYISTDGEAIISEGSSIYIDLNDADEIMWRAEIEATPAYKLTEKTPYGIVWTHQKAYDMTELNLELNREYTFTYKTDTEKLSIKDGITKEIVLDEEDNNKLCIMHNVKAIIYELIVKTKDGKEKNVMQETTIRHYVPSMITSPIIVTDKETGESFDLSSSYREVVTQETKIALYSTEGEIKVPGNLPDTAFPIKVYGIPKDGIRNMSAKEMNEFANKYTRLSSSAYNLNNGIVEIKDDSVKAKYKFIAIQYTDVSDFEYEFTNMEREVFETFSKNLELKALPSQLNSNITLYGIKTGSFTNEDYLYRIPARGMENSIDLYADAYDIISGTEYDVDYKTGIIKLRKNLNDKYSEFVVDYLKKDSYAINFSEEMQQYELDISSEDKEVNIIYDTHDDGVMYEYMTTDIKPDKNKYIVLKEGGQD